MADLKAELDQSNRPNKPMIGIRKLVAEKGQNRQAAI
jgi:hypothetical protein